MLEKNKTNAKWIGLILMTVLLAAGCWWGYGIQKKTEVPELTSCVDSSGTIEVQEEKVPLAKPKVTTKKSTETKKKTVKLKEKSQKTYTKKKPTKTRTTTKTSTKGNTTTKVEKKVVTKVTEKYKKNSKKKTVTTKTTTTIKTTVTTKAEQGNSTASSQNQTKNEGAHYVDGSDNTRTTASSTKSESNKKAPCDVAIEQSAPQADDIVLKAYNTLGFTVTVNSSVSYAGYFNARNQSIILRKNDNTIYHELGHFLAFIAGNVDTKGTFKAVYKAEKKQYDGVNKAYVTQNSSEYFAESYRDYVLNPSGLQESRPKTYASIQNALNKITDSWIQTIKMVYAPVWK